MSVIQMHDTMPSVETTPMEGKMAQQKGRDKEMKQVWVKPEDEGLFETIAEDMERRKIDVRHNGKYSLSKVLRQLMREYELTPKK